MDTSVPALKEKGFRKMPTQADNTLVRTQFEKVYDDDEQQKVEMLGRQNERYGGSTGKHAVPRIQSYGFTSHPPKGSQAITTTLDGNPDKAMVSGGEHPQFRPKNLAEGELKLYEKWGGYLYGKEDRWIFNKGGAVILMIDAGNIVHINPPSLDWTP
jgi:phage gp45-like